MAYRRLLELYYDTELLISLDTEQVARRLRVTHEALQVVLADFFEKTENGYKNRRCESEIAEYQQFTEAGKKGAAKRWAKGGDSPPIATLQDPIANQNQNQNQNHKPEPLKTKPAQAPFVPPDWVPKVEWEAWMEVRRAKKAAQTDYALGCAVADLEKLVKAGHDPGEVLRKSIVSSWKSLYPVNAEKGSGNGKFNAGQYVREQMRKDMEREVASSDLGEGASPKVLRHLLAEIQ